jgi:hypothetical protein
MVSRVRSVSAIRSLSASNEARSDAILQRYGGDGAESNRELFLTQHTFRHYLRR